MAFGSGAVKITPSHDPNDYEAGKRHKLPFVNIFNEDGTINSNGGKFEVNLKQHKHKHKQHNTNNTIQIIK